MEKEYKMSQARKDELEHGKELSMSELLSKMYG